MERISRTQAAQMVENYNGSTFFTVTFIKRSDGSERIMNCRKGVKKGLKGGTLNYDPKKKGLVSVFDVKKDEPRMISLENIRRIAMKGKVYIVS